MLPRSMAETITISSSSESESEDAHAPTTISDSESDSDFRWDLNEYRAFDIAQNDAASESRVLPSWASNGASSSSVIERLPSQQDTTRALPKSMQPSIPKVRNINSSKVRDSHGKYYDHALPNNANSQNHMSDPFGGGMNNSSAMHENFKNRMLPPTLMPGKSSSTSQNGGYVDALRAAFGDERATTADERLIYQAAVQNLNQHRGETTLQEGLLSVPLLRHQKIALNWMLQKETRMQTCLGGILADDQGLGKTVSTIALIQIQKSLQSTSKPASENSKKTEALNLDDDEENVKATPENGKKIEALNLDDDEESASDVLVRGKQTSGSSNSKLVSEFRKRRPAAGTLVVCPASILRQWAREMDEKVTAEAKLSVLVYHGSGRTKNPEELAKYDVVLTTYAIVANEVPKQPLVDEDDDDQKNGERYGISPELIGNRKRKQPVVDGKKGKKSKKGINSAAFDAGSGPIAKVNWQRVVLDEAQTIKNHRTQVARACCGLRAKTRWCLSGTPIQNAIDELFSYFRFLKYDPYADYKSFCLSIKFHIARNSDHGYRKLQVILRNIMLRRTKATLIDGKPIISLPPKTIQMTKVDFSGEERAFYLKLETDSKSKFKAYAAAGTVSQNYANILLMLLRLRQACDHPLLAKGSVSYHVGIDSSEKAKKLPREMLISLYKHFEKSVAICSLCEDTPEDAVVTVCGHIFCYQCVSDYLTGDDNTCPVPRCKNQLSTDRVFSKATLINCISEKTESDSVNKSHSRETSDVMQNNFCSAKIKAVLDILQSRHKSCSEVIDDSSEEIQYLGSSSSDAGRPIKTIVFSQWTSMLDLVGHALDQSDIEFRRLDGSMSLVSRDRAVKAFSTDPEITVMLMSLKAGNLGLNMVAACQVILLDLWWNPATEDQAIDRAHRIGQTRPVTVFRLTIKDTIEDRILSLQDDKRKMVASAFGEDQVGASATRLTVEDLNYLFLGKT